jgi:hypothetical protein
MGRGTRESPFSHIYDMPISKRKRDAAVKKIKKYLMGSREFVPTQKKARYWFNVINTAAFDGKITFSNILVERMRLNLGLCTEYEFHDGSKTREIKIDVGIKTRAIFIATLSHEMVHILQSQTNKSMNHYSKYYLRWKRYFKKHFDLSL